MHGRLAALQDPGHLVAFRLGQRLVGGGGEFPGAAVAVLRFPCQAAGQHVVEDGVITHPQVGYEGAVAGAHADAVGQFDGEGAHGPVDLVQMPIRFLSVIAFPDSQL